MNVLGIFHVGLELFVLVGRPGAGDCDGSDDRTVLAVESQCDRGTARGCCGDIECLRAFLSEVHTTQLDVLAVVQVEDIHVTASGGVGHVFHHTRVRNAHLRTLQSVAPCHSLGFHTLIGVEPVDLLHRLLVKPVRHLLDGSVGVVGNLRGRHAAALMVLEGVEVHQVVVLTEHVGFALIVADAGVVAAVALCRPHDVAFRCPWAGRTVAHRIAQGFRTAGRRIA